MLPANQARKSANFSILNSLFTLSVSPLPHSPGCSESNSPSCSGSSSLSYPGSSSPDCSPSSSPSYSPSSSRSYSPSSSGSCPEIRPPTCPRSSSPSNPGDSAPRRPQSCSGSNSPSYSLSFSPGCPAKSLPGHLGDFGSGPVSRDTADGQLLQLDDLGTDAGTGFQHVDAGRERSAGVVPAVPDPTGLTRRNPSLPD
jgi:hypothetical protein